MIDLTRSLEDRQDSASLQIAILSFINVVINYKAGEVSAGRASASKGVCEASDNLSGAVDSLV